jgi:hypothetical protein
MLLNPRNDAPVFANSVGVATVADYLDRAPPPG